jgi:hypothetical protein
MNPAVARKGNFFLGAVGYITHDVGRDSAERVEFTGVFNIRTTDPEKAAKVMAWTALHAGELKAAAGVAKTGRKTESPVYHFTLNWEPGNKPPEEHMTETARSALRALGYDEHEAVYAVHTDKEHRHIHIVVNRVHPVTGKTHNPDNDQKILQRWAYEYEKGQGNVVCLERAIKYEKDRTLKAEYQRRLSVEIETGKSRESKPRPQWEAEKAAPFPKSKGYQELKAEIAQKVKELSERGRQSALSRAREWEELKSRHKAERDELKTRQHLAYVNRRQFNQAAGIAPYSWKAYQADRAVLRKTHAAAARELRAEIQAKDTKDQAVFRADQKAAWREFYALERANGRGQLDKALSLVVSTRVGLQGPEYRGHLAALFNTIQQAGARETAFGALLQARKLAFQKGLAERQAPALASLKQTQIAELQALRQRFDLARSASASRSTTIAKARDEAGKARAELLAAQRSERAALTAKHSDETREQQQAWAELNRSRSASWDAYKVRRARQAARAASPEPSGQAKMPEGLERDAVGDYAASRGTLGRDYGRAAEPGQAPNDPGRSISRKGPR